MIDYLIRILSGWGFGNDWNMAFMTFHHIANVIIPTDELHPFSEGLVETTNQLSYSMIDSPC
jgi:hypothetical protein